MTSPDALKTADSSEVKSRLAIPEGVTLAAIPFAGSLLAFAYESGYVTRFGVPIWLIRVELTHILLISALIGGAFMLWTSTMLSLSDRRWAPLFAQLIAPIGWTGIGIFLLMRAAGTTGAPATTATILALLSFLLAVVWFIREIILPIVRFKDLDSRLDRLQRQVNRDVEASNRTALGGMLTRDRTGRLFARGSAIYVTLIIAPAVCYFVGTYSAVSQMSFLVVKPISCVAIRQYGDATVCVGVDTLHRRLQPWVRLLPSSSDSLAYELRFLGRLRPAPR